jgi:hypothetical protein
MRTLVPAIVDDDGNDHTCFTHRGACRCRIKLRGDVNVDCDGDPGPDAFALLDAELAVRDAVGQRARTDAYHRRDTVRSHLRLLRS